MRLVRMPYDGSYEVVTVCDGRGDPYLLAFLNGLGADRWSDRTRLLARLEEVAQQGPPKNDAVSHQIRGKIRQIRAGRLRVLWFWGDGRQVIFSHGFVKKDRRTPTDEIERAQRACDDYQRALAEQTLRIVEEDEDDRENLQGPDRRGQTAG